jgi:hypothetical protein
VLGGLSLLSTGVTTFGTAAFDQQCTNLLALNFRPEHLRRLMMLHQFNSILTPDQWVRLFAWRAVFNDDTIFITFMSDGVTSGLTGPNSAAFETCLQAWCGLLGNPRVHHIKFMSDGVVSGLVGPNSVAFEVCLQSS